MNKKIFHLLAFVLVLFVAAHVSAAVTISNPLGDVNSFPKLLCNIAGGLGTIVATLGTIAIIISGILYLTSAGNPSKMERAKVALLAGIIGIIIGLLAKTIVTVVVVDILGGSGTGACQ